MLGKKQILFGRQEIVRGLSSSAFADDGGIAPEASHSLNPFYIPGVAYATTTPTNASTNLDNNIIASCNDYQTASPSMRVLVDAAGKIYSYPLSLGSSVTLKFTGADTDKYKFGQTDMVSFVDKIFISLTDDVGMLTTGTGSWTYDESWWDVTKGQNALQAFDPHPLLVFENLLWVADSNKLHSVDTSMTVAQSVLVLPSDEHIYALGIDPGTGLMLISVEKTINLGGLVSTQHVVYLYDGFSNKPRRKIMVDDTVFAFYSLGGTVYVGFGNCVGYWNGSGITFLRKLEDVNVSTATSTDMPYKHHFAHIRNILLVADGYSILAYGEVYPGQKAWFPITRNPDGFSSVHAIFPLGGSKFGFGCANPTPAPRFYYADIEASGAGNGSISFNRVDFGRPVFLRQLIVTTTGIIGTSETALGIGSVNVTTDSVTPYTPTVFNFKLANGAPMRNVFEFNFNGVKTTSARVNIGIDTQKFGIVSATLFYDVAE